MEAQIIKTKYGNFYLEATPNGLSRFEFPSKRAKSLAGAHDSALKKAAAMIGQYFEGKPVAFDQLKMDLSTFTPAEQKVLKTLAKIRRGQVVTYQELAEKAGFPKGARFVGNVMRKNRLPVLLPCHRVLRSGGGLGGYSLGLSWKKRLLELEGVRS